MGEKCNNCEDAKNLTAIFCTTGNLLYLTWLLAYINVAKAGHRKTIKTDLCICFLINFRRLSTFWAPDYFVGAEHCPSFWSTETSEIRHWHLLVMYLLLMITLFWSLSFTWLRSNKVSTYWDVEVWLMKSLNALNKLTWANRQLQ